MATSGYFELATRGDFFMATDIWTGARTADGVGLIKVDGRLVTVRRVV